MADWERVFGELTAARGPALLRYAYLLTSNAADAADLVQEALFRAFTRTSRGLTIDSAEAYVRRAVLTIYIDRRRRRRRWLASRHALVDQASHDGPEQTVVIRDDVQRALASLSPRQRACVVLRYYDDLPLAQIAERLGCGVGTVKRHLSDALARMETHLTELPEGRS